MAHFLRLRSYNFSDNYVIIDCTNMMETTFLYDYVSVTTLNHILSFAIIEIRTYCNVVTSGTGLS